MNAVKLELKNPVSIKIITKDRDYLYALKDYFSEFVPGYYFMPGFRNSAWDGKVSMFNLQKRDIPYGLLIDFLKFHRIQYSKVPLYMSDEIKALYSGPALKIKFNLSLPPWDFQEEYIRLALQYTKGIIRSATASGKSLGISYIMKILSDNKVAKRQIVIVPTTSLVEQFYGDMITYGLPEKDIGRVYAAIKEHKKKYVISTWQSLMKRHDWLEDFDSVICDEAHGAKAVEIKKILCAAPHARYRLGFTGTLPDEKIDLWNIKSYLGPIIKNVPTKYLIEKGYIAQCNMICVKIKYNSTYKGDYKSVKNDIFLNNYRLAVLKEIVKKIDSNILILVSYVHTEGHPLKDYFDTAFPERECVFIHGGTDVKDREKHRIEWGKRKNLIAIATYGVFRQGINIPSLKFIIFGSPVLSKIRVLQSIGRALRSHASKTSGAYVIDIGDIVKYLEEHALQRMKYYRLEEFEINEINLLENKPLIDLQNLLGSLQ